MKLVFIFAAVGYLSVFNPTCTDCEFDNTCDPPHRAGGIGGVGGTGGVGGAGGVGGQGGTGGSLPCEGLPCAGDARLCDTVMNACLECVGDEDCSGAMPKCDTSVNRCFQCVSNGDCLDGVNSFCGATNVCQPCPTACSANQTCDVQNNVCVNTSPNSLGTCEPCSNDDQCVSTGTVTRRCVPMEYPAGTLHGNYCLQELPSINICPKPYAVVTGNRMSVSGAPEARYCGIVEDVTTCKAVNALVGDWSCTAGTDDECTPPGDMMMPEEVKGSICRVIVGLGDRCTYACDGPATCKAAAPGATCAGGDGTPANPNWCGGE